MVSIIIPSYNAASLLPETLRSLQKQKYADWECIVVDDGSTDNTKEIVTAFSNQDDRYKYFYQPNEGPSAARNRGINESKGGYIQFLDSDDMLESDKLHKQVELLDAKVEYDIVYGNSCYFEASENGEPRLISKEDPNWQRKVSGKGDIVISTILKGNIMVVHSPLVRKSVFENIGFWDNEIMFNEDWDVWTRCALKGMGFLFDDTANTKALIRLHPENRSKSLYKMYLNGLKVCVKIDNLVERNEYHKILKLKMIYHRKFLEKEIMKVYVVDKNLALSIAKSMFQIMQLNNYKIYESLIESGSPLKLRMYYLSQYVLNTIKYKIANVS